MGRSIEGQGQKLRIESYFRLLQEAPDAVLIIENESGNILELNQAAEEMLGVKRDEIRGTSVFRFAPPGGWAAQKWAEKKLDEEGRYQERGVPYVRGDGKVLYADMLARTVELKEAKVTMVCIRDDTDRLADEEQVKRRNEELQFLYDMGKAVGRSSGIQVLMEHTLDAVLVQLDVEIGCIYLLDERKEQLLLTVSRGLGPGFVLEMGRIPRGKGLTWLVVESGEPLVVDDPSHDPRTFSSAVKKEGIRYYAGAPLFFGARILGAIVIATRGEKKFDRSITDFLYDLGSQVGTDIGRVVREAAIRQSEVLYREIFETSREPIVLVDVRALDVVSVNKAAERISGYREEELREQPLTQLFAIPDESETGGFSGVFQRLDADEKVSLPAVLLRKNGKNARVDISLSKMELGGKDYAVFRLLRFASTSKGPHLEQLTEGVPGQTG